MAISPIFLISRMGKTGGWQKSRCKCECHRIGKIPKTGMPIACPMNGIGLMGTPDCRYRMEPGRNGVISFPFPVSIRLCAILRAEKKPSIGVPITVEDCFGGTTFDATDPCTVCRSETSRNRIGQHACNDTMASTSRETADIHRDRPEDAGPGGGPAETEPALWGSFPP